MGTSYYTPQKNVSHFRALLEFLQELFVVCEEINIRPIIYGSLAYAYYTWDEDIMINDVDILIPESAFPDIIKKIVQLDFSYEETNYHSLKIFKDWLKIAFDDMSHYLGETKFISTNFNWINMNIIPLMDLKICYEKWANLLPVKRTEYLKKLKSLSLIR